MDTEIPENGKVFKMRFHLFMLFATATAVQNSNFNVTPVYASSHACGSKCQEILHLTNQLDLETVGSNFSFSFFETASNFSGDTKPGDVLKVQPLDLAERDVPAGTTVYRIQYASKDLNGSTVPVTGFVAFPYTAQFTQGGRVNGTGRYRLAAYAHGTIGLFAGCAPSNSPNLYDYDSWTAAVQSGYAVVATDYAGLGNNYTTHKYLSLPAQVNDVYYSVVAARKIFGSVFTKEWVSFGHSQGGGTVWKLAESEYVADDASYLGTVALAPATYIVNMLLGNIGNVDFAGYLSFLPIAAERAIAGYTPSFLADAMKKRVELAETAQLCISGMLALPADLKADQLVSKDGLERDKDKLLGWQKMLSPAQGDKSPKPILVLQGLNDTSVLPGTTKEAWETACKAGNEVHLRLYPGIEHSPLLMASQPEWLAWMDGLFMNKKNNRGGKSKGKGRMGKKCTSATRQPFSSKFVKQPPEGGAKFLKKLKDILQG